MGILAWIVLGLIAGLLARAIYPGPQPGGVVLTTLLGIVGALVGGFIGRNVAGVEANEGFSLVSILWATIGALVVLFLWGLVSRRKSPTRV